jgi:hypothetical protein
MWQAVEKAELPDQRLRKRLRELVESLSANPSASLPQVFQAWGKMKAAYRFFDNKRISHQGLLIGQREATRERLVQQGMKRILLVQDTTSFDFKHHPATEGLGILENEHTWGFMTHSTLAVSEDGIPQGLWEQVVWSRQGGQRGSRRQREFRDKESYKWVAGLPEMASLRPHHEVITVCDREAHLYEFLAQVIAQDVAVIVRAMHGRSMVAESGIDLFATVRRWEVQHVYPLTLPRRPDRASREAQVELRYGTVTLARPTRAGKVAARLTVQCVEVHEPQPPPGEEALHWLLLTTLPLESLAHAHQVVTWYTYRWLIERFHYVLKSGCRLEERQLQSQERLTRLLAVFNLVAWRLLWLTYQARHTPDAPCVVAFTAAEWQALYCFIHQTPTPPPTPPTLHLAVRWLAQLGGFLARKSDGEPGVKVLWRGWIRLQDITQTWVIAYPP